MSDHYQTLGVQRTATPDEIKKAYRKLASQHHPDKGGDTAMFQKIEEAYRTLSDPQQRQAYDNPAPQWAGGGQGFPGGFSFNFGGGSPFDDILRQFHQQTQHRQRTYTVTINITLEQVANGGKQSVSLNSSEGIKAIEIEIPRGIEDGRQVQYNGIMSDGLLMVTFRVLPHRTFERNGFDLHQKLDISIWDLVLGTTINVSDIYGNELVIDIQPKTKPNTTLRLAGRGLEISGRRGNQYVLLSPVIPDTISVQLLDAIRQERNSK